MSETTQETTAFATKAEEIADAIVNVATKLQPHANPKEKTRVLDIATNVVLNAMRTISTTTAQPETGD